MREMKIVIALFSLFSTAYGFSSNPDEIFNLPGLKFEINFRQYSGYLNASNGKFLHYWFVESQNSPSKDPVVLWMNGGPGCSSLDGFLTELGPFHVNSDGKTLYNNPFSWNKVANVIFLEAPAGVGYSYSLSGDYNTDDDITSQDNYLALQHFFVKFPQFKKNDFYITGESYAGVYIPTLSMRVFTGPADINFKGFAIGNGYLDQEKLSRSLMFFFYYHGLVPQALWNTITQYCCSGCSAPESCDFYKNVSNQCAKAVSAAHDLALSPGINIYNLYSECASSSASKNSRISVDIRNLIKLFPYSSGTLKRIQDDPPCMDDQNVTFWLNQKSVRQALHIPRSLPEWGVCSSEVEAGYLNLYKTLQPQVTKLVQSGKLRALIYNGDVDMACNFLGDDWFSDQLKFKVLSDYQPWHFNDQIAGFVKTFKNMAFVTIKGSGHMVPQDKPGPALKMISNFLFNKPLN